MLFLFLELCLDLKKKQFQAHTQVIDDLTKTLLIDQCFLTKLFPYKVHIKLFIVLDFNVWPAGMTFSPVLSNYNNCAEHIVLVSDCYGITVGKYKRDLELVLCSLTPHTHTLFTGFLDLLFQIVSH